VAITAVALSVTLTACKAQANQAGSANNDTSTNQPAANPGAAQQDTVPVDPSSADKALNELDNQLGGVDASLSDADTPPADAD
jgi:hypothetical protein